MVNVPEPVFLNLPLLPPIPNPNIVPAIVVSELWLTFKVAPFLTHNVVLEPPVKAPIVWVIFVPTTNLAEFAKVKALAEANALFVWSITLPTLIIVPPV